MEIVISIYFFFFFFFSSRRRHTRWTGDWSSDVCSSDLRPDGDLVLAAAGPAHHFRDIRPGRGARETHAHEGEEIRSEERRVGKECSSRWLADHQKKKEQPSGDLQERVLIRNHDYDQCFH